MKKERNIIIRPQKKKYTLTRKGLQKTRRKKLKSYGTRKYPTPKKHSVKQARRALNSLTTSLKRKSR